MSVTAAAALKKVATTILTNPKLLKKVGTIILVILVAVFMPICVLLALFRGEINVDTDRLTEIMLENMSEEDRTRIEISNTVLLDIESKMTADGYGYEQIEKAKILCLLPLYSYSDSEEFADKLNSCFSIDQSDEELITAINSKFGTSIKTDEFIEVYIAFTNRIVAVAKGQIGNEGGNKFWSWYGFTKRVEWCACFVSWCEAECGYIELGITPKFSSCVKGVSWFKNHGQWLDGEATPEPGMIIFYDWDNKEGKGDQDGKADHTGIVERVENGTVYTIEGNLSDSCKQTGVKVGYYEILGYGTY